jgi:hypothetical protein
MAGVRVERRWRHFSSPPDDGRDRPSGSAGRPGGGGTHPTLGDGANDVGQGGQGGDRSRTSRDSARWARTVDSVSPFRIFNNSTHDNSKIEKKPPENKDVGRSVLPNQSQINR